MASRRDTLVEMAKEWLTTTNPGLVTQEDLAAVEHKIDGLLEMVGELEERVSAGLSGNPPA